MTREVLNVMKTLTIDELSTVDRPMQAGARAVLMKRDAGDYEDDDDDDSDDVPVTKMLRLTTSEHAHAHLLDDEEAGGSTSWNEGLHARGHSHPWVRNADGTVTIGEADGHSHDAITQKVAVDLVAHEADQDRIRKAAADRAPRNGGSEMDEKQRIEKLEADLAEARAFGKLTDAEKAYCAKLDAQDRATFLKASASDRASTLNKALEADPVVYKSEETGTEYRKSDDGRMVDLAKRNDELAKAQRESTDRLEKADLEKRATTEIGHLGGDLSARTALLKAVGTIQDEATRTAVAAVLKGADAVLKMAQTSVGTRAGGDGGAQDEPLEKLDALARDASTKKGIPFAKAYDEVLQTAEGRALYDQFEVARRS